MNDLLVTCKEEIDSEIENIEAEDYEVEKYFSEDENSYRLSRIPDEIEIIPIMKNGECNGISTVSLLFIQKEYRKLMSLRFHILSVKLSEI